MNVTATAIQLAKATPDYTVSRRRIAPGAFQRALKSAAQSSSGKTSPVAHTVRPGETLWSICKAHLCGQARPADASAISDAVQQVARHNGIADANFIVAGQKVDVSILDTPAKGVSAATAPSRAARTGGESEFSGLGGPSLVSNPRTEALWRAKKAAMQAKEALAGILKEDTASEAAEGIEKSFNGLLGGPAWLSSGFGLRKDPFTARAQKHSGVDLAAPKGTEVYALQEGRVTYSGWRGDYGRLVVVRHEDGTETRYGHLSERLVKEGETVDSNTIIGKVGTSGRSTGPHLHFEIRKNARPVNPLPHLLD